MKINYCLSITSKTKEKVLEIIKENRNDYHYFEIWLDTINGIDKLFVNELVNILEDKLILLFQRGATKNTEINPEKKLEILKHLANTNVFFDLDISEKKELAYIQENKLKINLIVSYHNYQETPVDLGEIVKQMEDYHPSIYKIATMCESQTDAIKLLLLQQNFKAQKKKHIVLGMGEFGTITRVYGTLWGNELIYAPLTTAEKTADGQLKKEQLELIFKQLDKND